MESFEQRDIYANRFTGFLQHSSHYLNDSIAQLHQKWDWSKGHTLSYRRSSLEGWHLPLIEVDIE